MHYQLLHPMGTVICRSEKYTSLAEAVREFNHHHEPIEPVSYYKATRSIREFGVYSQLVWCHDDWKKRDRYALLVVVGELNSDAGNKYVAPVQKNDKASCPTAAQEEQTEQAARDKKLLREWEEQEARERATRNANQP